MTVEKERQAIDQVHVDAQVAVESSRGGGQERSAQPRERHCGVCGKPGHNARTCQVVINVESNVMSTCDLEALMVLW